MDLEAMQNEIIGMTDGIFMKLYQSEGRKVCEVQVTSIEVSDSPPFFKYGLGYEEMFTGETLTEAVGKALVWAQENFG